MKVGLLSNCLPQGTRQIVLASICVYAFVINTSNARINIRPLRWFNEKMVSLRAVDIDPTQENSGPPTLRRANSNDYRSETTLYPYRATEAADLIPKVDGLSFVDDFPRVMRFHAGQKSLWTTQGVAGSEPDGVRSSEQNADASADGKKCLEVAATSDRSSLQGAVAGASFIGGLAVSMSLCLLCYRIRRRIARRTFERKQQNESSSIAATDLDPKEIKSEP